MLIYRLGARFEDMASNHFLIVIKAPATTADTIQLVDVVTDAHVEMPFEKFFDNTRYRAVPDDALIRLPDGSFLMGEEIEIEMGSDPTETFGTLPVNVPKGSNVIYPTQFLKRHPARTSTRDYHPVERLALIQGRIESLAMSHPDISVEAMAISSMLGDFKTDLEAEIQLSFGA